MKYTYWVCNIPDQKGNRICKGMESANNTTRQLDMSNSSQHLSENYQQLV